MEAYTAQHFEIQILNLWMNWEKLYPNLTVTVEKKTGNLHEKRRSRFKLNVNDWDIPFPKILRIYQWIWKLGKMKFAYTTEYLAKSAEALFLANVYKSIALENELKRLKC